MAVVEGSLADPAEDTVDIDLVVERHMERLAAGLDRRTVAVQQAVVRHTAAEVDIADIDLEAEHHTVVVVDNLVVGLERRMAADLLVVADLEGLHTVVAAGTGHVEEERRTVADEGSLADLEVGIAGLVEELRTVAAEELHMVVGKTWCRDCLVVVHCGVVLLREW